MLAALGCGLIASQQELLKLDLRLDVYKPSMPAARRKHLIGRWHEAVKRSMRWNEG
jgi:glycerol kinase